MATINIAGLFDKKHISIALAEELKKFGTVAIITDNPIYKFLIETREAQYDYEGISILYADNVLVSAAVIRDKYKNIIMDTYDLTGSADFSFMVFDDLSESKQLSRKERTFVKSIAYTAADINEDSFDYVIEKDYNDELIFMSKISQLDNDTTSKDEFISFMMSIIIDVKDTAYMASLSD